MKNKLFKPLAGIIMAGMALMPSIGMAQSSTSTTQINAISTMLQQIQALQTQIDALKNSQKTLQTQAGTEFTAFVTSLSLGSKGDAVTALQALLAANPNIYPEGQITGYFGKATEKALKRLQKENGLEQAGRVGPKTIALLNKLLGQNRIAFESDNDDHNNNASSTNDKSESREGKRPCAIVPPGHLIAPGWLKKNERPTVPECQKLPKGIEKKGDDWKPGTTTRDTIAPVISGVGTSNLLGTTTSIVWTTNENSNSKVWFGISSPVLTSGSANVTDTNSVTSHSVPLTGLSTSTTYYFVVGSVDPSGNTATSSQGSFVTTAGL